MRRDLATIVRNAFANGVIEPFRIVKIERMDGVTHLNTEMLPSDLTAYEWLPIYQKSVPTDKKDAYLYLGACGIVSVAAAIVLKHQVMRVQMPEHDVVIKKDDDSKIERIYHTHHLVMTSIDGRTGNRLVLDLTGSQFGWPDDILNRWVTIDQFTAATGVTIDLIEMDPMKYLQGVEDDEQRKRTQKMIGTLKNALQVMEA